MGRKRYTPEQIIAKLRQAEIEVANGATVPVIVASSVAETIRHRRAFAGKETAPP